MAKVITYSRRFPATHARKGQPTFFVDKFLGSIGLDLLDDKMFKDCEKIVTGGDYGLLPEMIELHDPKHHTIRKGNRWKVGEMFSPRIWSESAYHSPQIKIGPDMPVLKTWDIYLDLVPNTKPEDHDARFFDVISINGVRIENSKNVETLDKLAKNDGLSVEDFREWFKKPFQGQIICWNPEIEY